MFPSGICTLFSFFLSLQIWFRIFKWAKSTHYIRRGVWVSMFVYFPELFTPDTISLQLITLKGPVGLGSWSHLPAQIYCTDISEVDNNIIDIVIFNMALHLSLSYHAWVLTVPDTLP
jgi:hypothetical protein